MSISLASRARSVRLRRASLLLACCISAVLPHSLLQADGPADNVASKVRPIPPVGIELPAAVRDELLAGAKQLEARVAGLTDADKADTAEILVLSRAVRIAAEDGIFYNDKEFDQARGLLKLGNERVDALAAGKRGSALIGLAAAPSDKPQLLVGGFRSHIDGSIQPYGLVIPAGVDFSKNEPLRLDVWLHGRGENVSEVAFLNQRLKSVGEIAPEKTIVLHPYGRYCNAFKFAGEIDVLEAIEHVKSRFKIDNDRTNIRGFSMGGAGCWQMAVHYPQVWMAATPGAGFSETTEFLRVFQQEEFKPTPYQKALLHWYDCPDWTNNLRHLPTVAYSGEIDKQKQAADVMAAAFKDRGMELKHIIGPQTAHKIHPDSKVEIEKFLSDTAVAGRPKLPLKIDLTTYTLRYHRQAWLSIDGLEEHWREARVQAELQPPSTIVLKTSNITALTVKLPADQKVMRSDQPLTVRLNDQTISVQARSPGKESIYLVLENGAWKASDEVTDKSPKKQPGLQGPIDDAFMGAFVFVGPDAKSSSPATDSVGKWLDAEFTHAKTEWHRQFRGDIVEVRPDQVTEADLRDKNLVLFGSPKTNSLLAKILPQLPVKWNDDQVQIGKQSFAASSHVPVLIYPNPLNPKRYVVINSGFTYREFAYLNNARQIAMLPDWAIVDVSKGSNYQMPGEVKAADFFNEKWEVK